jgi:hypothetical protein
LPRSGACSGGVSSAQSSMSRPAPGVKPPSGENSRDRVLRRP